MTGASPRLALALALAFVAALAAPILFAGLGASDLAGDEALYSAIVDRMLATGSWWTPADEHGPFFEKPPLKFWLVAAAIGTGLTPSGEASCRVLDPAFGLMALVYVVLIGRRAAGLFAGVAAAVVLLTHYALLFDHGLRAHTMEALLVLAYCGGVFHFLAWAGVRASAWGRGGDHADPLAEPGTVDGASSTRRTRRAHAAACIAWCAVGFMTKFVAVAFLPASLALATAAVPDWRRRAVADHRWWAAMAACAALAVAPWFVANHVRHGAFLWRQMAGHILPRVSGTVDPSHLQPWWFYLHELREGWRPLGPWVALGGVIVLVRTVRERWPAGLVLLLWGILPTVALSLSESKLRHYFHPFLPPFALWAGAGFAAAVHFALRMGERLAAVLPAQRLPRWVRAVTVAMALFALGVALVVAMSGPVEARAFGMSVRTSRVERPLLGAVLALLAWRARWAGAMAVLVAAALWSSAGRPLRSARQAAVEERRPLSRLAACLRERAGAGTPRVLLHLDPGQDLVHEMRYYLGAMRFRTPSRAEEVHRLTRRLKDEGERAPVVVGWNSYPEVAGRVRRWPPELQAQIAVLPLPEHAAYLLLPPPYAECAPLVRSAAWPATRPRAPQ